MRLRETLLGLLVLAALGLGVWWARGPSGASPVPASGASSAPAAADEASLPDVTLADASVDAGDVRLVLSADRPVVALTRVRFRARAESKGTAVPLEEGRLSFEMRMPMGDHRYRLLPGDGGWQEAEVVLPACGSGERTWFATLEGKAAGKHVSARYRLDLTPAAEAPAPAAAAR
ncbi:hypothetical protein FBQ97_14185 [Acidobacteria bacterium ACD]|nr:MAG: hypothetical protein EDX89_14840 [Acidobacteriota bacterium]MDL1950945.1 hypothetical protein [Acidobacteria bacterium ACD]